MMKKGKYILIMLSLFICAYLFSNRMTPRIENIASKEINQFIQILINHTSFTQKIDTHKLYKKENNSINKLSMILPLITSIILKKLF